MCIFRVLGNLYSLFEVSHKIVDIYNNATSNLCTIPDNIDDVSYRALLDTLERNPEIIHRNVFDIIKTKSSLKDGKRYLLNSRRLCDK